MKHEWQKADRYTLRHVDDEKLKEKADDDAVDGRDFEPLGIARTC